MKQAMEKNAVKGTEGLAGVHVGKQWGAARDTLPSIVQENILPPELEGSFAGSSATAKM